MGKLHLLEKEMAAHPSILAWQIPWTEEPGGLQSMRSQSWTQLSVHMHTQITQISLAFDPCLSVIGILTLTKIIDISDDIFSYYTPFFFQIPGAPDDEAVRIFLEFERVESAIKGKLYS